MWIINIKKERKMNFCYHSVKVKDHLKKIEKILKKFWVAEKMLRGGRRSPLPLWVIIVPSLHGLIKKGKNRSPI